MTTLDGMTRSLTSGELLICDALDVPIGLAGIMGGEHTEIGPTTSTVALEFAWFEPIGIASSVNRTALRSDASARWERGVDPYGIDTAIARFVELLGETCPGLVVHAGAVDARAESLPPQSRHTPGAGQPGQPDHRRRLLRRRGGRLARPDRIHGDRR